LKRTHQGAKKSAVTVPGVFLSAINRSKEYNQSIKRIDSATSYSDDVMVSCHKSNELKIHILSLVAHSTLLQLQN
jgi:hypothetical protein